MNKIEFYLKNHSSETVTAAQRIMLDYAEEKFRLYIKRNVKQVPPDGDATQTSFLNSWRENFVDEWKWWFSTHFII